MINLMKNVNKKALFYLFVLFNIALLIYVYLKGDFLDFEALKAYLSEQNFFVSYLVFVAILIVRGLTLLPGTPFLLAGIYLFTIPQVFIAIQIAIICYCVIIYHFSKSMNFKIPEKILSYEEKIKTKEIPIIFSLCFIPGVSINVLVYFLSIINIKLKNILIGVLAGTSITSLIYISLIKGVFESVNFIPDLLERF